MQSPHEPIKPGAASGALQSATAPGGFSWDMARMLAKHCSRAYNEFTICDRFTDAHALACELVDENCLVIAFRGSKAPEDFIQDAKFKLGRIAWISHGLWIPEVHHGFLEDFDGINTELTALVKAYLVKNPTGRIYITGHSLGGALAILAALEFQYQKMPIAGVYTFGQPRVGNWIFRNIYNAALRDLTFHIINADDPVPLLPPLLSGYRDEGNEIYLPRAGGWILNPSIGLEIVDDVLGAFDSWRNRKLAFLPNHFIAEYQGRMGHLA